MHNMYTIKDKMGGPNISSKNTIWDLFRLKVYLSMVQKWVLPKIQHESATSSHGLLFGHLHRYGVYGPKRWGV